ncbi:MAG: hypothetical protein MJB14_19635 [Spirochaetes bacterium]|nr:hypothetical protein [Spirochaetota bacterium]
MNIKKSLNHLKLHPKLLTAFIGVVCVTLFISLLFSILFFFYYTSNTIDNILIDKINTARLLYNKKLQEIERVALSKANDNLVILNLELLLYQPVHFHLSQIKNSEKLTFLSIIDTEGKLLVSGNDLYFTPPDQRFFSEQVLMNVQEKGVLTFLTEITAHKILVIEDITQNNPLSIVSIVPIYSYAKELLGFLLPGIFLSIRMDFISLEV